MVGAAVGTVLRPDPHGVGVLGVRGNSPDGWRLGQAASQKLPPIIAHGHTIEAGFDGPAWGGLTS